MEVDAVEVVLAKRGIDMKALAGISPMPSLSSLMRQDETMAKFLASFAVHVNEMGGIQALIGNITRLDMSNTMMSSIQESMRASLRISEMGKALNLPASHLAGITSSYAKLGTGFDTGVMETIMRGIRAQQADSIRSLLYPRHEVELTLPEEPDEPPLFEQEAPSEAQRVVLADFWAPRILELNQHPEKLREMSPRDFEALVADLLSREGFSVQLTKATRDGGYDILARSENMFGEYLHLIECKRYAEDRPVDVTIVRGLIGVGQLHGADRLMIVTTSDFTKDAVESSERLDVRRQVRLRNYKHIRDWLAIQARILRG